MLVGQGRLLQSSALPFSARSEMSIRVLVAAMMLLLPSPAAHSDSLPTLDGQLSHGQVQEAWKLAVEYLANTGDRDPLDYVRSYILLIKGNAHAAEPIARRLVRSDPTNHRFRHLLINVLVTQKRFRAASFHIRKNEALASDIRVREQYVQMLQQIEKRNPRTGVSFSMSAVPSTNASRGTSEDTIYLNGLPFRVGEQSQEKSGSTVTVGLTGYHRFDLTEDLDAIASTTLTYEKSVEDASKDVFTAAPSVQLQRRFGQTLISAGPLAEFQWSDGRINSYRYGVSASAARQFGTAFQGAVTARFMLQDFPDRQYLDGFKVTVEPRLRWQFEDKAYLNLSARIEREKTEAGHLTHSLGRVRVGLEKTWGNGFYTDISISAQTKLYEAPMIIFERRRDNRIEIEAGVSHERLSLFGVMPYIGYRYTKNASNVPLYEYESNDLIISARRRF